ncbi:nucleotidyltransferase family protein [Bengtsoniella intestinalis]|uniref:nucleotidyltransferase family protein n=1 Tax=Bengtsoniella intestinalis TaxID=3073143 RepID=UPI00391FB4E1
MDIGCVILAAGNSQRFGDNKLLQPLQGKSLVQHAFEKVPQGVFAGVTVVTQYPPIMALATDFGFSVLYNDQPELGISHSLQMGLTTLRHCNGILFMVCDQPLLRTETLQQLVDWFVGHPHFIVAAGHDGVRGNPCIFPAEYFSSLMTLSGDQGGAQVIRQHSDALRLIEVDPRELFDVDHPEALASLRETV